MYYFRSKVKNYNTATLQHAQAVSRTGVIRMTVVLRFKCFPSAHVYLPGLAGKKANIFKFSPSHTSGPEQELPSVLDLQQSGVIVTELNWVTHSLV